MRSSVARTVPTPASGPSQDHLSYRTGSVVITDEMIVAFGDKNVIHQTNPKVAPGLLLLKETATLVQNTNMADGIPMFRSINRWKWVRPVYGGQGIYAKFTVRPRVKLGEVKTVVVALSVLNQSDEVVARGEWELTILPFSTIQT